MVVHALISCKCPTWAWNTDMDGLSREHGWPRIKPPLTLHDERCTTCYRHVDHKEEECGVHIGHPWRRHCAKITPMINRESDTNLLMCSGPRTWECACRNSKMCNHTHKAGCSCDQRLQTIWTTEKSQPTSVGKAGPTDISYGVKNSKKKNMFIRSCLALEEQCGVVWIENDLSSLCVNE